MEMTSSASLLKKSIHVERSVTIKRIIVVDCSILSLVCSPCIKIRYENMVDGIWLMEIG
jgi:hypothetical protein